MKRFIAAAVAASVLLSCSASAITVGKWDISHIPDAVQRAAKNAPKDETQRPANPYISEELLQQIYAAKAAQREAALKFWGWR